MPTYLTSDIPGIGGRIKQRPDDFLVEEQPLYQPTGQGEHLYLFIEKKQRTTRDVVRQLARLFNVGPNAVGFAGLKDKHAITRQLFSVHLPGQTDDPDLPGRFEGQPFTLLWADRHANKLRRGHLAGNRFVIYIRDVAPTAVLAAKRVMDRLVQVGVPNYFGAQRFGHRQNNHLIGQALLLNQFDQAISHLLATPGPEESDELLAARAAFTAGDLAAALERWPRWLRHERHVLGALVRGKTAHEALKAIEPAQRDFYVSAWQSDGFNQVLDARIRAGLFSTLLPGDLAVKDQGRSVFPVDEAIAQAENAADGRMRNLTISPTGPLWGADMTQAAGQPGQWEQQALEATGLTQADLAGHDLVRATGARRPLRVVLRDPSVSGGVDEHGGYVRLAFELGKGSFATVVLREVMKSDQAEADSGDEP